ncbi:HNH endonuclease [Niabella drilacis]|uniref:HNH endonuclease n=1 Tax=Niabella drilacis (strain DSM 25811 / CCM 8410 / CCUG 62505 / LMG 26954 / E90) TaxID=1285928 RepID=A0A1G6KZH8_NIADE|nr:hypothetical protein [Niabella drilacis]SDC36519.1 hypothetical protein SAMN04487894_102166 [Niabella drilacis]
MKKRHEPYTDVHFALIYELGRSVISGETKKADIQREVALKDIDKTTAGYFIHIHQQLLKGKIYKRAMSAAAYSFYLKKIYEDYGEGQLALALKALREHLVYRPNKEVHKVCCFFENQLPDDLSGEGFADEQAVYKEGRQIIITHILRERNRKVVELAKRLHYERDPLMRCECCDFSYTDVYGAHGSGFIEAHHNIPISELTMELEIKPGEFSMLCANCHRMIHKRNPWLSVDELRIIIKGGKSASMIH